ncbi:zinc ribbon domain-containing protein [Streptomyces sp. NPDC005962]|uniref:NADase-type glycan-binding domain-containing protein n=1 Tax=Streptomyces sp. NPDC005962 TaxID=3154466 RepID=UPI0033EAA706
MSPSQAPGSRGRGTEEPTLTCDECGTRNEPGQSFCDGCNAVLPDPAPTPRPGASSRDPWADGETAPGASGAAHGQGDHDPHAHPDGAPAPRTAPGTAPAQRADPEPWPPAPASGPAPDPRRNPAPAPRPDGGTAAAPPAPAAAEDWPGTGGADRGDQPRTGRTGAPAGFGAAPTADDWPDGGGARGDNRRGTGTPGAANWPPTGDPVGDADPTRPVPRATAPGTNTPATNPATGGNWNQHQNQNANATPPPTPPQSDADRARALLVPVADPQGEPERPPSISPVLPGRPAPARPEVRAPVAPENHGGVACPWCHVANRPDRHFCARCAMPMAQGPENPARLPWWRRLLDYRNREQPWAGDRPRLRHQIGRILRWVALAAVLALVAWALFQTPRAVSAVRDHFAKRAPLNPDSYKASRSFPEHGPDKAFDVVSNSWWGPGITGSAQGDWLEARFRDPVRLLDIGITPGESGHGDTLTKSALPHRIEARITTDDGKTTTRELNLDQGAGFQRRPFRAQNVTAVRFTIQSAYGADGKKQVAIAEIEFFGPSKAGRS